MDTKTAYIKQILKRMIKKSDTLNQKVVAAKVGITTSYMSQLLDDKRGGRMELIARIAAVVGTSLGELDQMVAGMKPDPAKTRIRMFEMLSMFADPERAVALNRKLLEAERAGVLDAVEDYLDFQLLKPSPTGPAAAVRKRD